MPNKKKLNTLAELSLVFSTGDTNAFDQEEHEEESVAPEDQAPRVRFEKKGRKGKPVTIITDLIENDARLAELSKHFKSKCGVGGSVKEGTILLQGDQRDKVLLLLKSLGYSNSKKAGS